MLLYYRNSIILASSLSKKQFWLPLANEVTASRRPGQSKPMILFISQRGNQFSVEENWLKIRIIIAQDKLLEVHSEDIVTLLF